MPTRHLPGSALPPLPAIGYGLMKLTWSPTQTPDEQAFAAMIESVDRGSVMFNSGEFYGHPERTLNLQLLSRFFEKYPTYASKIFLSVKGAIRPDMSPDSSDAYLRESVENINKILKHRKMDLFEPARVDKSRPIEETIAALAKLRDEGHFKYIGLSEVSATTIRRAAAVAPIGAVEVEYSPWTLDIEHNGVLAACKELNIPIIAYSPLGRGFLTGTLKSPADIPEGDMRGHLDRFSAENFPKNLLLVEKLVAVANRKGISPTQLALVWNLKQWDGIIPIPGSTRVAGVIEACEAAHMDLSPEEMDSIRTIVDSADVSGLRYNAHMEAGLAA